MWFMWIKSWVPPAMDHDPMGSSYQTPPFPHPLPQRQTPLRKNIRDKAKVYPQALAIQKASPDNPSSIIRVSSFTCWGTYTCTTTLGLFSSARDCQISRYLNYPTILTIPIANYLVNLCLHQPEVAISGIFGWYNHPKISWASLQNIPLFVCASSPARRLELCVNAEQNISS